MENKKDVRRVKLRLLSLAVLGLGLSGCAAAAIPLTAAEVGVGGFEAYKLVQTSTGGSVGVAFPGQDGKEAAPPPLPALRRVAVWPGDQRQVRLAEKLMTSRRFDVTTPNRVRAILAAAKMTSNVNDLTARERLAAFATICRRAKAQLVLASLDGGSVTRSNGLSLSPAKKIGTSDLLAYSCERRMVIWRDQMTLIVEVGDKTPSDVEISRVAGEAWAQRVIAAESGSTREIGSLGG